MDYALKEGIITSQYTNYGAYATRSEFAKIFANALPLEALTKINEVDDGDVPDVLTSFSYGSAVYRLYRAGILTGSDSSGTFYPNNYIKRSEVVAIATRMANIEYRKSFTLESCELSATEIAAECSPSVFYIELYDSTGTAYASGSGFFISSSGLAVTNYHVIDGAASAKIFTTDGKSYDVSGVYDYSEENDLAILQIKGSDFSFLEIGDSRTVATGMTVYAIGSPMGFDNTFTQGIVSNANRKLSEATYIQIDAAISHGSSGGALLNTSGKVIGITCGGIEAAENLNLAVPVNLLVTLTRTNCTTLASLLARNPKIAVSATPSVINMDKGGRAEIAVSSNHIITGSVDFSLENESLVSCYWSDWAGDYSRTLNITGLNSGTTTITITLLDSSNNVLASTTATVTVSLNSSTPYYYGYSPVPDYGAYTGTDLYSVTPPSATVHSVKYCYSLSDIHVNTGYAKIGYVDLLVKNGFVYLSSLTNSNGYTVYIFANGKYTVLFGLANISGVICTTVTIKW